VVSFATADSSGAVRGATRGWMYLEFIAVPEDKVIKNRVHRGCSAGTLEELEAEIE
jgi:hypothetical protein